MTKSPNQGPQDYPHPHGPELPPDMLADRSDTSGNSVYELLNKIRFQKTLESIDGAKQAIQDAKQGIFDALQSGADVRPVWERYYDVIEEIAGSVEATNQSTDAHTRLQLGFNIYTALIYCDANQPDRYRVSLKDAQILARNKGLDNIASALRIEIEALTDTSELSPEYLLELLEPRLSDLHYYDMEDAVVQGRSSDYVSGLAFALLTEEHEDPVKIFRSLGIPLPKNSAK